MSEIKVVSPSPASREMMKSLADRLMFTAPTAAELVVQAVRRALDALIATDYVAFSRELFALADALDSVAKAFQGGNATENAIASLDPDYFAYVRLAVAGRATASIRSALSDDSIPTILGKYAKHVVSCTHGPTCPESAAYVAELKARGIEVQR